MVGGDGQGPGAWLLNQMYVTHYNKQGMDIEELTDKLSNIHVAAALYGASADYTGDRGELYLKYRSDTYPYSVAEFLGLVEPTEDQEEITPPDDRNGDNLLDLNNLVGTYANDELLSGYIEISSVDFGQFNVRVQDYRVTLLDAMVESTVSNPMVLFDEGGAQLTFTFYPAERGVYLEDTSGAYNGWYYQEVQEQESETQFWGTYDMISSTPNATAHLEIIYGSDDGQIYLSGAANYDGNTSEILGVLEIVNNQHFRFKDKESGTTLDMTYDPTTSILTVSGEEDIGATFAGTYAQTSGFIDIR